MDVNWNAPVGLNYAQEPTPLQKVTLFLGHYDCRVYLPDVAYIDIGAGSLMAMQSVVSIGPGTAGSLGSIGRCCEINVGARILSGGEHRHDMAVNITFSGFPLLSPTVGGARLFPDKPISIGNDVVISDGVRVLSGVKIGDGAVVGANAVVTRDVEPFSIVGGVPARKIGERKPCLNWWDFSTAYLYANAEQIDAVIAGPGPHQWRPDRPKPVISRRGEEYELLGFLDGDQIRHLSETPRKVQAYMAQALGGRATHWIADIWAD